MTHDTRRATPAREDPVTTDTHTAVKAESIVESARAVREFGGALAKMFLHREAEIRGLLIGAIAGENVLMLGPPGTAKSALTLAFGAGLGWTSFVRLLGRTTVPEELFGPYSLKGLREDRYERVVQSYLPTAQVAFLDEIFKASSAILNALLTVLNEHAFDNGAVRLPVPLRIAVGASNELPQEDGLAALYDRFMLRYWVDYLQDEDEFSKMLVAEEQEQPHCDPHHFDVLHRAFKTVDYKHLANVIVEIKRELAAEQITASDRRWRKAMGLIRASAALDGRTVASRRDLSVLADCLWDNPTHRDIIRRVVAKQRNPELTRAEGLKAAVAEEIAKIPDLSGVKSAQLRPLVASMQQVTKMVSEAERIDASDPEVAAVVALIKRDGNAYAAKVGAVVASLNRAT